MSSVLPNQKDPVDEEFEQILAMKWCWDAGIRIFPVISPLPSERTASWKPASFKTTDKVKICVQMGSKMNYGSIEYDQNQALYDKILELYVHYYSKRKTEQKAII